MSPATALADVRRVAQGPIRTLFLGQFLNSLGSGLTLSLVVVYLHSVRGLPVATATALLAWQAVLAMAASPLAGSLVDRFSPRPVLLCAALVNAVGLLVFAQATTALAALAATSIIAIGGAGIWSSSSALIARLVPSRDRTTAFGFGFMLTNLGLGLGGLVGSTIIDLQDPATFTLLYRLTALTFVVLFVAVLSMGDVGRLPVDEPGAEGSAAGAEPAGATRDTGSWREVLADRSLLRFAAAGLLMLTFGYGSVEAGVSLYITEFLGLDERFIGILFAANTAVIVIAQLFVLGLIRDRLRSRVLAGVGVLWALCWLLFGAAFGLPSWAAVPMIIVAISVFAVGETMWSPTAPALVNDLAPEHLRGRYNSVLSALWGTSMALGPLLTGLFLAADQPQLWTVTLVVGCLLAAVVALGLRGAQDGPHRPAPTQQVGPDDDPDLDLDRPQRVS